MPPKRVRTVEGSCWPCKDRRVICDLQRPQCSRCAAEGQPCGYGKVRLRWCNGVAARGRFAGQNIPIPDQKEEGEETDTNETRSDTTEEINNRYDNSGYESSVSADDQMNFSNGTVKNEPISLQMALISPTRSGLPLRVTPEQLMLYFEREVVDRFNLGFDPIQLDLRSLWLDPALQRSVTAVASAHRFQNTPLRYREAVIAKKKARLEAIRIFRQQLLAPNRSSRVSPSLALSLSHPSSVIAKHELHEPLSPPTSASGFFLINVLLCILDGVIDPHDEDAATYWHFQGGRAILNQWKLEEQLFQQKHGLLALMLSVYATMDLTNTLLGGEDPYFDTEAWASFSGSEGWWGTLSEGDPFLEIMGILSRLAHYGHIVHEQGQHPTMSELSPLMQSLQRDSRVTEEILDSLPDSPFSKSSSSPASSSSSLPEPSPLLSQSLMITLHSEETLDMYQSWIVFCTAYRLTALIYIYRVFFGLDVLHPLVQQATALGVRAICGAKLSGKLSHCLLFPTLVIGAHCRSHEQQTVLRQTLGVTATFLFFGAVQLMDDFLQTEWAKETPTTDWWQCFDRISRKAFMF